MSCVSEAKFQLETGAIVSQFSIKMSAVSSILIFFIGLSTFFE